MIMVERNRYDADGFLDTFLDPVIGNLPALWDLFPMKGGGVSSRLPSA
jgi:hypothetical protein